MIGKGFSLGPKQIIRQGITSPDLALPQAGSGFDAERFQFAILYFKIVGGGCDITPHYYREALGIYVPGSTANLDGSGICRIDVDGHNDIWIHLTNFSSSPTIDIELQLMNRD